MLVVWCVVSAICDMVARLAGKSRVGSRTDVMVRRRVWLLSSPSPSPSDPPPLRTHSSHDLHYTTRPPSSCRESLAVTQCLSVCREIRDIPVLSDLTLGSWCDCSHPRDPFDFVTRNSHCRPSVTSPTNPTGAYRTRGNWMETLWPRQPQAGPRHSYWWRPSRLTSWSHLVAATVALPHHSDDLAAAALHCSHCSLGSSAVRCPDEWRHPSAERRGHLHCVGMWGHTPSGSSPSNSGSSRYYSTAFSTSRCSVSIPRDQAGTFLLCVFVLLDTSWPPKKGSKSFSHKDDVTDMGKCGQRQRQSQSH